MTKLLLALCVGLIEAVVGGLGAARGRDASGPALTRADLAVDGEGYQHIFDGKTLAGWEGDPRYWRVEDGCLVGEVTPETVLQRNTFIIWRGGVVRDFGFIVDYRVSDRGNSGINYRSAEIPELPLAMRGYQADIDGENRYTGQNYEERGRGFIAHRGQVTWLADGKSPTAIASTGEAEALKAFIKVGRDWNEYHLIVRDNVLIHIVNQHLMSVVIDDDRRSRRLQGLLGVQVHTGPPMKVELRNFRLKAL